LSHFLSTPPPTTVIYTLSLHDALPIWDPGFLQHLAVSHALYQRWQSDKVLKGSPARVKADVQRALDYVRRNKGTAWGWALLCLIDRKSTRLNSSHVAISYAVFCLKQKR